MSHSVPHRVFDSSETPTTALTRGDSPRHLGQGAGQACQTGTHVEWTMEKPRPRLGWALEALGSTPNAAHNPHLQEEADLIHGLVLRDEGLEEQVKCLHGLLVQHLLGQMATWCCMAGVGLPALCPSLANNLVQSLLGAWGTVPGEGLANPPCRAPGRQ